MGQLVKLKNACIEDEPEVRKEIVDFLKAQLARAESGELQAFGFVGVDHRLSGANMFFIGDDDARSELVAHVSYLSVQLAIDAGAIAEESEFGGGENGC